jgi:hypothetical protein
VAAEGERGANTPTGEIEQMQRKTFKSRVEDLVREFQEEAKVFAGRMGFAADRTLTRAIELEEAWWSEQGCCGSLDLESATSEELRFACLDALRMALAPLSCSWTSDVLEWAETVDGAMAILRRWLKKAAAPPSAKGLAAWTATYEALTAAREQEHSAEAKKLALEKELEQKAAFMSVGETPRALRLVKRAA